MRTWDKPVIENEEQVVSVLKRYQDRYNWPSPALILTNPILLWLNNRKAWRFIVPSIPKDLVLADTGQVVELSEIKHFNKGDSPND